MYSTNVVAFEAAWLLVKREMSSSTFSDCNPELGSASSLRETISCVHANQDLSTARTSVEICPNSASEIQLHLSGPSACHYFSKSELHPNFSTAQPCSLLALHIYACVYPRLVWILRLIVASYKGKELYQSYHLHLCLQFLRSKLARSLVCWTQFLKSPTQGTCRPSISAQSAQMDSILMCNYLRRMLMHLPSSGGEHNLTRLVCLGMRKFVLSF